MSPKECSEVLRSLALLAISTLVLVSCGTTVSLSQRESRAGISGGEAPVSGNQGFGSSVGSRSGVGSSGFGLGSAGAASHTGAGSVSTNQSPTSLATGSPVGGIAPGTQGQGSKIPPTGPGWDSQHVYIGFTTQNDITSAGHALAVNGLDFGNPGADAQAVAAAINKSGGIFGRSLVPVLYDIKTTDLENNPAGTTQAICTAFTQDHKVAAVVTWNDGVNIVELASCLHNAHTVLIYPSLQYLADNSFVNQLAPDLVFTLGYAADKMADVWVTRLLADGFFTKDSKVGLLYQDPSGFPIDFKSIMTAAMAQHGLSLTDSFAYRNWYGNESGFSTDMQNAVLRFHSEGINRVLPMDSFGAIFFMNSAQGQGYHPIYGVTSYDNPEPLTANVPAAQLQGSLGVGWDPTFDTDQAHDPGNVEPGRTWCDRVIANAGQAPGSNRSGQYMDYMVCDSFRVLAFGAQTSGGLTDSAISQGIEQLQSNFPTAATFQTRFGVNQLLGASRVRDLRYEGTCSCYIYSDNGLYS